MLPEHYEAWHLAQQIGFEGPDLAKKHWHKVLKSAKTIFIDMIKCVNDAQFHVASQSYLSRYYLVDIQRLICDCPDFPRVWFCKHLCAVKIWNPFIPPVDNQDQDLQRSAPILSQMPATSIILSGKGQHPSNSEPAGLSGALPDRERVTYLPWTAPDWSLTGYDYGPNRIISHGLLSGGVISHVRYLTHS